MSFENYTPEQYRALSLEELDARRDAIAEAYETDEETPIDALDQERKACLAEYSRRQKVAEIRSAEVADVMGGAGKVTERKAAKPSLDEDPLDSDGYKRAFQAFIQRKAPIPAEYRAAALSDVPAGGTFEDTYTNTTDTKVMVPTTMGRQIIKKLEEEYGQLYAKVSKTSVQGGLWFRVADFEVEASWLGKDKKVSGYQSADDGTAITFSYFELECRISQTLLAAAVTWADFQATFVDKVAKAMAKAIDMAIIKGEGPTANQPLGIVNETRIPAAQIIEVSAADIDSWEFWRTLHYRIPRLYRDKGTWCFGDTTWGFHIDKLADSDGNPLGKYDPINDAEPYRIMNRPVELMDETILPGFDDAAAGDVFAVYGDFSNYLINTQPGMPLTTVRWVDHEENKEKTKALVALDGKVLDPYGFVLLKKKASA